MRLHTTPVRTGVAWLAVAGLVTALGGCSDDPDRPAGDAAGVDVAPSAAGSTSASAPEAADELTTFSDSFDDDANHWGLPPSEAGSASVEAGDFVWDSKEFEQRPHLLAGPVIDAFDQGTLEMTDVTVSASVTLQRGAPALGVFCREVPDADSDFQWYEFVVGDGYAAIRLADSAGNLEPLAETKDASLPVGTAASLSASCVTDDDSASLSLSLDGVVLLTTQAGDPLGNGGAGLQGYDASQDQADEPMLVAWHDFAVQPAQ
jgi:hypothetical protein